MSQKFSVNRFKWVEDLSEFNEYFIKSYNEKRSEAYFVEVDIQYTEKLHDLPFLSEIKNVDKVRKLAAKLRDKNKILYT